MGQPNVAVGGKIKIFSYLSLALKTIKAIRQVFHQLFTRILIRHQIYVSCNILLHLSRQKVGPNCAKTLLAGK